MKLTKEQIIGLEYVLSGFKYDKDNNCFIRKRTENTTYTIYLNTTNQIQPELKHAYVIENLDTGEVINLKFPKQTYQVIEEVLNA